MEGMDHMHILSESCCYFVSFGIKIPISYYSQEITVVLLSVRVVTVTEH